MSGDDFTLKECLAEYLKGGITEMPKIESRVVCFNPLKITDDDLHYLEVQGLQDVILKQIMSTGKKTGSYRVILIDWNFMIKRVPHSTTHYIDIQADSYRLEHTSAPNKANLDEITNMLDDVDIKFLFERKKKSIQEAATQSNPRTTANSNNRENQPPKSASKTGFSQLMGEQVIKSGFESDDMLNIQDILNTSAVEKDQPNPLSIKPPNRQALQEAKAYEKFKNMNHDSAFLANMEDFLVGKREPQPKDLSRKPEPNSRPSEEADSTR